LAQVPQTRGGQGATAPTPRRALARGPWYRRRCWHCRRRRCCQRLWRCQCRRRTPAAMDGAAQDAPAQQASAGASADSERGLEQVVVEAEQSSETEEIGAEARPFSSSDSSDLEEGAPRRPPPAPQELPPPISTPLEWASGEDDQQPRRSRRFLRLPAVLRAGRGPQVRYPPQFKALVTIVLGVSIAWVGNYLISVLPTMEAHRDTPCKYNDSQLTYNAKMLFVYFLWFAMARTSLFLPCIAARVALIQSRTHGFCRTYCVHLVIRDGPLYIFVVGSMLFWFHLMQSPNCQNKSPKLYQTLKLYAIYSCMISVLCLFLAYWHNKLLMEATRHQMEPEDRRAPPDTISRLQTLSYDENIFGDEEGKLYPSECAICLGAWEPHDVIKVTPCQHAFHEECIGNWLSTARTCALCRQDLTKRPGTRGEVTPGRGTPRLVPSSRPIGSASPAGPGPSPIGAASPAEPGPSPIGAASPAEPGPSPIGAASPAEPGPSRRGEAQEPSEGVETL